MLRVESLSIGFPHRRVGADISFQVATGEVLCVLGPNGGGKTTLFRTLLGLLPALGGRVHVDGDPVDALSRHDIARRAGYVPQQHAGYFAYSVREMVLMGRTAHLGIFSAPGTRDHAAAARAIDAMGIAHLAERPVTEISGGERQLALVARALAQEPGLLVMDEPTASLDFGNQVRVLERVRALAAQGIAVVFSTHDPDHAFLAADRALLLGEGRVLDCGPAAEVIVPGNLQRLYGIHVEVLDSEGRRACLPSFSARMGT